MLRQYFDPYTQSSIVCSSWKQTGLFIETNLTGANIRSSAEGRQNAHETVGQLRQEIVLT